MNERELFQAILEKHPNLIEEIREKAIDEFIDIVLNRHILTKENKEALKFILEYAKKDMLKNNYGKLCKGEQK